MAKVAAVYGVKCRACGKFFAINPEPLGIRWDPESREIMGSHGANQTFPEKCGACRTVLDYHMAEVQAVENDSLDQRH